jgi:hypothetical protein
MNRGGKRIGAGRKIGSRAQHTLQAEQGKALLIQMYLENIRPINQALIDKAKSGDIQAIKELHDRVYNKAAQPLTGGDGGAIQIAGVEINVRK